MPAFEICTIGFTQSSAQHFFTRLKRARVERVLDIRLRNDSQLAGFAKAADFPYFLRELVGAEFEHDTRLAPSDDLFTAHRAQRLSWDEFTGRYLALLRERDVPGVLDRATFEERKTVLLCSEAMPARCHRGLLADLLAREWDGVAIVHL